MRRAACIAGALAALAAGSVHCSLGLDESKLAPKLDGGFSGDGNVSLLDGQVTPDTGSGIPTGPDAGGCTTDDNCKSTHGCLRGKCDQTRKSCVYDVCHPSSCSSSVCDNAARACGPPATIYRFRATQFTLGAPLACFNCVAAMYPWFFALVPTGLIALNVSNPASSTPPQIPVTGLNFVPTRIVGSGRRLWMLGASAEPGGQRVQIAYLDAPTDPFVPTLSAVSASSAFGVSTSDGVGVLARGGDTALLLGGAPASFPAATVPVPVPDTLGATPLPIPQGSVPLIMSGTRMLTGALATGVASFGFVENAGSAVPTATAPVTGEGIDFSASRSFSASSDGAVFMASGVHSGAAAEQRTRAVKGYFLVPSATGAVDFKTSFDVEAYDGQLARVVPPNAPVVGPSAMLDAKTAFVTAQAKDADTSTAVLFVRNPGGVIKEIDATTVRRQVLPLPVSALVGATASNGLAYLVAVDKATEPATTFVFDPACAP